MKREVREEACVTVVQVKLVGFARSICIAGSQKGPNLVRSNWRARVELAPWKPEFEIPNRRVFPEADKRDLLIAPQPAGSVPVLLRAFDKAMKSLNLA